VSQTIFFRLLITASTIRAVIQVLIEVMQGVITLDLVLLHLLHVHIRSQSINNKPVVT